MDELNTENKKSNAFLKKTLGIIRLIHVLPVLAITVIIALLGYFANENVSIITHVLSSLAVFFLVSFIGIQNDYVDRKQDREYNKRKAIADGWISSELTFIIGIIFFTIFSILSIILGLFALVNFWITLYLHSANLICMFYNIFAKNKVISILPYLIAFPMAPIYVWLVFGGFDIQYVWYIPMIIIMGLAGHLMNELPDFNMDKKYENQNFTVFIGKKASIILYLISSQIAWVILIIVFIIYNLNFILFIICIIVCMLLNVTIIGLLWRLKWHPNILVFNFATAYLGVCAICLILLLNLFR